LASFNITAFLFKPWFVWFVLLSGSTDNLAFILVIAGGAVAAAVVIATVTGVIIWRLSTAKESEAQGPSIEASPVAVSRRPAIHPRFIPSHLYSRGYAGYHSNGYCGNVYSIYARHPYCYQSRINVYSGQYELF